jgi:hypothetical protein
VLQSGSSLTLVNAVGGTSAGSFANATTLTVSGFGLTATISNSGITFSNGVVWKKLNLAPTYTVADGGATAVAIWLRALASDFSDGTGAGYS